MVPPTYLHAKEADRIMMDALSDRLAPYGCPAVPAAVPKKLLAMHGGLAVHGRNNITCAPGMGSFHLLAAFFSDPPRNRGEWHGRKQPGPCAIGRACQSVRSTGALEVGHFLLRARVHRVPQRAARQCPVPGMDRHCLA